MNDRPTPAPAGPPSCPEEAKLRCRLLKAQVKDAENKLAKSKRDDARTDRENTLKERQLAAVTSKAELDLETARRESDKAKAEAAENRIYTFLDGVNNDTLKVGIHELGKMSRRFPKQDITIILNSPGGSVIAGLALFDHIKELRASGHHVTVKVRGMAASMGGILLQAGDTRVIGRDAMVLIHEVGSGTQGKISQMEDDLKFSSRLWDKLAKILSERSKMTPAQIKAKARKLDWWLDANEAIKLGFADKIG